MKTLGIVLALLAIPFQLGAGAQGQQPSLIAYAFCGPYIGASGGWELWCEIRLSSGDSPPISLVGGTEPAWSADGLRSAVVDYDLHIINLAEGSRVNLTGGGPRRPSISARSGACRRSARPRRTVPPDRP